MSTKTTVSFLRNVLGAMQIDGSRGKLDIYADRLAKAASYPTLDLFIENLLRSVDAKAEKLHPHLAARMMKISSSSEAPQVLRWLRDHTKLIAMLAACNDKDVVEDALAEVNLPDVSKCSAAAVRQPYEIGIRAKCETPLSHGSDTKAGNATLFRRIDVLATNGTHMTLPYYSGNAIRGQMRDLMADHFLNAIGLLADRSKPAISLWLFYALYAGGALEEKSDSTKALRKQIGDNGAIKSDGIRVFRDMIPGLSLLGCALGNRVLPGHIQVADLRPVCAEWGTGSISVNELTTWEFLTRREDHEDHNENHSMITSTEVLRAGTELEGGIDTDSCIPDIELSALGCGIKLLKERGMLGGENRRGFGRVAFEITGEPNPDMYEKFLSDNRAGIVEYLKSIGGIPDDKK